MNNEKTSIADMISGQEILIEGKDGQLRKLACLYARQVGADTVCLMGTPIVPGQTKIDDFGADLWIAELTQPDNQIEYFGYVGPDRDELMKKLMDEFLEMAKGETEKG